MQREYPEAEDMHIALDDLSDGGVENLLAAHLRDMANYSPPDSIHALDKKALRDPSVTFWSARIAGVVAGCGALKSLSEQAAELKSMKTAEVHLRKGIAQALLDVILKEARRRKYQAIYLETGSHDAFLPAVRLYERAGFLECGPFGDYVVDPYSRFFKLALCGGGSS